jgi:surface antigen
MKRLSFVILLISLSVLGLVPASAVAAAPQDAGYVAAIGAEPFDGGYDPDPWQFYAYECTSYVAYRLNQEGTSFSDSYNGVHWGNASHWVQAAKEANIPSGSIPKSGAVAVWVDKNHVAFVDSVTNGLATFNEYNASYTYDPPKYRWNPPGYDRSTSRPNPSGGAPTLYLYFPNVTVPMRPASSWLTYLNTTVGRTCNLGFSASTSKITESFTDSVTLLGKRVVASGTELVYRIVDVSVFTGQPMTRSAMRAVYLVPNSGELNVIPQTISSGGVDYQFAAFEVYPPPGQLSVPSETMQSSMVVKLGGSTASARKQLGPLNGAELLMGVNVKPAPAVARIRTDVGVFRNTVGIVLTPTTLSWLTKVPVSAESETSQLLSGFQNLLTTTEYYAVGVGPVESGVVGAAFSLVFEGCA